MIRNLSILMVLIEENKKKDIYKLEKNMKTNLNITRDKILFTILLHETIFKDFFIRFYVLVKRIMKNGE